MRESQFLATCAWVSSTSTRDRTGNSAIQSEAVRFPDTRTSVRSKALPISSSSTCATCALRPAMVTTSLCRRSLICPCSTCKASRIAATHDYSYWSTPLDRLVTSISTNEQWYLGILWVVSTIKTIASISAELFCFTFIRWMPPNVYCRVDLALARECRQTKPPKLWG